MVRAKNEPAEISAFERRRLENIATNQAILKDISTTADKIIPKPKPKPAASRAPRKRAAPVKREEARPTRTSSRLAGIEADSENAKRKAEVEYENTKATERAKRQRVVGDLDLNNIVVEGQKWNQGENFLADVMRGATPYHRTFREEDIKETTDKELKALREKMSGLELYEGFEPNNIKITPERIYSMGFHPTVDKPLVFAGDKLGSLGLFDASQTPDVKAEDDDDAEEQDDPVAAVTAFKLHSRTISSFAFPSSDPNSLYSASYDSSIRRLDLQKGVAVEVYAPASIDEDLPISGVELPYNDPHTVFFSSLHGSVGRHDTRSPSDTELWQLSDKKIGGFTLHPLHPHLLATASLDRALRIWDVRKITGKGDSRTPAMLGEHFSSLSVSHAAWSAAGHVATASYDNTVKIHSFPSAGSLTAGEELDEAAMEPTATIRHNNQTGRWVTILKAQWQQQPADGIQKFVIGNMNRFVDVYASSGEQLAQLGGDGISAVPAVAQFHPTQEWVAGGTASGKLCLWM